MRAYRWFLLFSLCAHVLLLALAEAMLLPSWSRPRNVLKVTLLQRAVPLPIGEPAAGTPRAGQPPAPSPPKPRGKKPAPRPTLAVTPQLPPAVPPPPSEIPPPPTTTTGIGRHVGDATHSAAQQTDGFAGQAGGGGRGGYGGGQGRGAGGTGAGGDGGVLARPDYGVNPKPPYPLIARRMGAQGVVVLRVFVQANGTVGEVTISQSSGFSILDESALKTVRERWRFVPARLDGRPVASWVEVPIRFVLAGS
jgi:protein TonB